jgi:hypothetical protein
MWWQWSIGELRVAAVAVVGISFGGGMREWRGEVDRGCKSSREYIDQRKSPGSHHPSQLELVPSTNSTRTLSHKENPPHPIPIPFLLPSFSSPFYPSTLVFSVSLQPLLLLLNLNALLLLYVIGEFLPWSSRWLLNPPKRTEKLMRRLSF